MSLITVQQALARIYTDSKLRDEFLTNPDVVGRTLKLNCVEIQQLSNLSSQEVNMYASSLKYKRLGEIRKLLPLTVKVLGNKLNELFFQYAETYLPSKQNKHLQDAMQLCRFILNTNIQPEWTLDIVNYEYMQLQTINTKKLIFAGCFNYPIHTLIHSLDADFAPKPKPKANLTIWFRFTPRHKLHSLTIPLINIESIKKFTIDLPI